MIRPNPYVGPRAFRSGEKLYGRNRESRELVEVLIAERIVLLYSPSGAGKTSLVQAEVIPRMKAEDYQVLPVTRPGSAIDRIEPRVGGNRYVERMIAAWEEDLPQGHAPLTELSGITLASYLLQRDWIAGDDRLKLIILDQFEEILTADPDNISEKLEFFRQLGEAIKDDRIWMLAVMREEYSAALDGFRHLLPTRLSNRYRLDLLGRTEAMAAIREPARTAGIEFDDAAVEALCEGLCTIQERSSDGTLRSRSVAFVEPLYLQVTCHWMRDRLPEDTTRITAAHIGQVARGDGALTAADEVDVALGQFYGLVVSEAANESGIEERRLREWLQQELLTPQGLRRQVLRGVTETAGLANEAVKALEARSLVRADSRSGAVWYEITHDRLASAIVGSNERWFVANLPAFQVRATRWHQLRQVDDALAKRELLNEKELREANAWNAAHSEREPSRTDRAFLEQSTAAVEERARVERNRREKRLVATGVGIAVVVVLIAIGVLQTTAKNRLETAKNQLEKAYQDLKATNARLTEQQMLARARLLLSAAATSKWVQHDPELASLLALHAHRLAPESLGSWGEQMLRTALQSQPYALSGLLNASDHELSFSGHTRIAFSRRGTAALYRLGGKEIVVLPVTLKTGRTLRVAVEQAVRSAMFSPADRFLLVATEAGISLFDTHASDVNASAMHLPTTGKPVGPACFSADETHGATLVQIDGEGPRWAIHPWSIATDGRLEGASALAPIARAMAPITALACGDAGRWIAWGDQAGNVGTMHFGSSGTVHGPVAANEFAAWPEPIKKELSFRSDNLDYGVASLLHLPRRQKLVALYRSGPPRLFDVAGDGALSGHYLVPDAASEAKLKVSQQIGQAVRRIEDPGQTSGGDASPDETLIAVAGGRAFAGIWDLTTLGAEPADPKNGLRIAYREQPGLESTVRTVRYLKPPDELRGSSQTVYWLAAADSALRFRIWHDGLIGAGYSAHHGGPGVIYAVGFLTDEGDGPRLAYAGSAASGLLRVDREHSALVAERVLDLHPVRDMAVSADRRRLVIARGCPFRDPPRCIRQTEYSWLIEAAGALAWSPVRLAGGKISDGQWAAAITPEGRVALTAGWDRRAVAWKEMTGSESQRWSPIPLVSEDGVSHSSEVLAAAIHPNGNDIVTGTRAGSLHLWRMEKDRYGEAKAFEFELQARVHTIAFHPQGCMLVAGDDNGFLWRWDIVDGKYVSKSSQPAHRGAIFAVRFSPNGLLITGGSDGRVGVWGPVACAGTEIKRDLLLEGPDAEVLSVDVSDDERFVAAGDAAGIVHLWTRGLQRLDQLACRSLRRNLSLDEWNFHLGENEPYRCTCSERGPGPGVPKERLAEAHRCNAVAVN